MTALSNVAFFDVPKTNRGLTNIFTSIKATDQNRYDLLNFRSIGEDDYKLRVRYYILKEPSVKAPNRKKTLQTFTVKKVKSKKVSQLERDKKLLLSAMKKKIQFSQKIGQPIENPDEQLLEFPRSNDGIPLKGQKSYFTKILEKRYSNASPPVITPYLPPSWKPQCSMLEGMFMMNTAPLPNHSTLKDYGDFLLSRFIITHFKSGCLQVHVIFDHPCRKASQFTKTF